MYSDYCTGVQERRPHSNLFRGRKSSTTGLRWSFRRGTLVGQPVPAVLTSHHGILSSSCSIFLDMGRFRVSESIYLDVISPFSMLNVVPPKNVT